MSAEKFVYIMRAGENHYKVGITNSVLDRIKGVQTGNALAIKLVSAMYSPEARRLEKKLHKWLKKFQASGGSEWFILTPEQALGVVTKLTEFTIGGSPMVDEVIAAMPKSVPLPPKKNDGPDELFDDAIKVIYRLGRASASMLQRRLRVGYARAARLLDELEKAGVVGPPDGARPREVVWDSPTLLRAMHIAPTAQTLR